MKSTSPLVPLLMLLGVGFLSVILMLAVPDDGWGIGATRIKFKTWESLWDTTASAPKLDVDAYLARLDSLTADSLAADTLSGDTTALNVKRSQGITSLQFLNGDSSPLFPFFEALEQSKENGINVHVVHYGDSQIESDRMTGYLRQKWQEHFGGKGPGLVAPVPVTPSSNVLQSQSGNWKRYTAYGYDNGKSAHGRFGILASYGRFTDPKSPDEINPSDTVEAWIELRPSRIAHSSAKSYSTAEMYFGYHQYPVELIVSVKDSIIDRQTYPATGQLEHYSRDFNTTPEVLRFTFRGPDSPDVQNIILQSPGGVHVDNVALRGSNGNIFKRIQGRDIGTQLTALNTRLIIMQFGGNSVPYITAKKNADEYGKFFQAQIRYLKQLAPEAAFLVIGPSDMSTSVDGVFQSWQGVPLVRDAMKEAAFAEGCAFWDMYEVMGGNGSMISWVEHDPPLAGPDYTHFTPNGARKVAEYLYKAIQAEYEAWNAAKKGT